MLWRWKRFAFEGLPVGVCPETSILKMDTTTTHRRKGKPPKSPAARSRNARTVEQVSRQAVQRALIDWPESQRVVEPPGPARWLTSSAPRPATVVSSRARRRISETRNRPKPWRRWPAATSTPKSPTRLRPSVRPNQLMSQVECAGQLGLPRNGRGGETGSGETRRPPDSPTNHAALRLPRDLELGLAPDQDRPRIAWGLIGKIILEQHGRAHWLIAHPGQHLGKHGCDGTIPAPSLPP